MSDPKMTATLVWTQRSRRRATDQPHIVIEFVPGAQDGNRAYFWIGDRDGNHITTIDARILADWIDSIRGAS